MFAIDDNAHAHPKFQRAGDEALGMWTRAGAWSKAYKRDGFVPEWWVSSQPKGKVKAARLVEASLWHHDELDGEKGYRFHDWLDHQWTAEEVERARQQARDRQRKRRAKRTELAAVKDEEAS